METATPFQLVIDTLANSRNAAHYASTSSTNLVRATLEALPNFQDPALHDSEGVQRLSVLVRLELVSLGAFLSNLLRIVRRFFMVSVAEALFGLGSPSGLLVLVLLPLQPLSLGGLVRSELLPPLLLFLVALLQLVLLTLAYQIALGALELQMDFFSLFYLLKEWGKVACLDMCQP